MISLGVGAAFASSGETRARLGLQHTFRNWQAHMHTLAARVREGNLSLGLSGICTGGQACINDPQLRLLGFVGESVADPIFEPATTCPTTTVKAQDRRIVIRLGFEIEFKNEGGG